MSGYRGMISKLGKWTAVSTFSYSIILVLLGVFPVIVPDAVYNITGDYHWIANIAGSVGILPIVFAFIAWFLSGFFQIHNFIASKLNIRYLWEKYLIVKRMAGRVDHTIQCNREYASKVMRELYYPSIKEIDQHNVELFWESSLYFWALFEHVIIVFISALYVLLADKDGYYIYFYFLLLLVVTIFQFFLVVAPRTKDQVDLIPLGKIDSYFSEE